MLAHARSGVRPRTEHRLQNIPDRFPLIAHNEYQVDDVNKFAELARAPRKAASLQEATGGRLERSPRYRDLFAAGGIGAELRGAFVADGATWGAVARMDEDLLILFVPVLDRVPRHGDVSSQIGVVEVARAKRVRVTGRGER